ncbi:MAG: peptidylprolyl isomerase [Clostridium sp.]|nr:peptidylprolyl isomerase [Clostridium sp.]
MLRKIVTKFFFVVLFITTAGMLTPGCNKPKSDAGNPRVQIEMEDGGIMVLELYPEYAPETVDNFISLAEEGFYNGLTFHRIIKGFMIQGGAPNDSSQDVETIKGEFAANDFTQNSLKHKKGVISMARTGMSYDSASCQFFIVHGDSPHLDGDYAAFGKLTEGMDVLDKIADTPVETNPQNPREVSLPKQEIKIKTITVL